MVYISPKNQLVAVGEPFVVECVGSISRFRANFYKGHEVDTFLYSFRYPEYTGFPVYTMTAMSPENSGNYSCYYVSIPSFYLGTPATFTVYGRYEGRGEGDDSLIPQFL